MNPQSHHRVDARVAPPLVVVCLGYLGVPRVVVISRECFCIARGFDALGNGRGDNLCARGATIHQDHLAKSGSVTQRHREARARQLDAYWIQHVVGGELRSHRRPDALL